MTTPDTLSDIRNKVRRCTGMTSPTMLTDNQIDSAINTFYMYDFPEHLRIDTLRSTYMFNTTANRPVYDFPTDYYLNVMPTVHVSGYETYMTQSRTAFNRLNSLFQYRQDSIATGDGGVAYTGTLTQTPIIPGYKRNPPGAYTGLLTDVLPIDINWSVLISAEGAAGADGIPIWYSLIDDGMGNLVSSDDTGSPYTVQGTVNYITGAVDITNFVDDALVAVAIPLGNPINAQYIPYVASRPYSVLFYENQIMVYPVPDQVYTISFEAFRTPTALLNAADTPQLKQWWQLLAYGAADKIFTDNGDFDSIAKYRPLLDEQMRLALRRTLVQQSTQQTATIYDFGTSQISDDFGNPYGRV